MCSLYVQASKRQLPDKSKENAVWQKLSVEVRTSLGVSQNYSPWTGGANFAGEGLSLTQRVVDILNVVAIKVMQADASRRSGPQCLEHVYVDVSQSHARLNFTRRNGLTGAFTTATELYSYKEDRVVLPHEMMWMHGFPVDCSVPSTISPGAFKDMIGNGMSLPSLATMVWALQVMMARGFEAPEGSAMEVKRVKNVVGNDLEMGAQEIGKVVKPRSRPLKCRRTL